MARSLRSAYDAGVLALQGLALRVAVLNLLAGLCQVFLQLGNLRLQILQLGLGLGQLDLQRPQPLQLVGALGYFGLLGFDGDRQGLGPAESCAVPAETRTWASGLATPAW